MKLTARSIADSIKLGGATSPDIIVCGGGRLNDTLMRAISEEFGGWKINKTEDFGVDGDFLEAGLCAWIAYSTVNGLPSNLPAVTGASGPRILGGIFTKI